MIILITACILVSRGERLNSKGSRAVLSIGSHWPNAATEPLK